ncbi:MAG: T9SS type A sorting domain-containing protein [Gemmatimonadales bacterium]|nr:T9SS type A sorting domain-containing protein [Gemmatimonadales bacterium]
MRIRLTGLLAVALVNLGIGPVLAQEVVLEPLLSARNCTALLAVGDKVLCGTYPGGVLVMDRQDPSVMERWIGGRELAGNQVSGLAWSGRNVWVATRDNGLTCVQDLESDPTFRQYMGSLGSSNVTCVTGTLIGNSEVIYYGMDGAGIGKVTDGIPGFLFSANQDGLIDDDVNDLQFLGEDLFIATGQGISRLRKNIFTDQNSGLTSLVVNDLDLDLDGNLIAASDAGVFRWDVDSEAWVDLGSIGYGVTEVASQADGTLWALGQDSSLNGFLYSLSGATWVEAGVPYPNCSNIFADEDLWVGGKVLEPGMDSRAGRAYVSRALPDGGFESWKSESSLVVNNEGICYGQDGAAWMGSWSGLAISAMGPEDQWRHIYEVATEENDWNGLSSHGDNVLCMSSGTDGTIWAGQYRYLWGSGVLRIDPQTMSSDLLFPTNSGLGGGNMLNILTHPDGPMIFLHDNDGGMVDILLDTDDWEGTANWISLPQTFDAIGSEKQILEALVERRDVIWFAVLGAGLIRWDINGNQAGPDDELTWRNFSDDYWSAPVTDFFDSRGNRVSDPKAVWGMDLAPDGSIWAGGTGLVRFVYNVSDGSVELLEHWEEKTVPFEDGLLNNKVSAVKVDVNGDLWVAMSSGLNRLRSRGGETTFDQWIDGANYLSSASHRILYSPNVVAALPGGTYRRLAIDETRTRLLVSSTLGVGQLIVEEGYDEGVQVVTAAESLYCYPNPWNPAGVDGSLKLGGFASEIGDEASAEVTIYNLEGQLIMPKKNVTAGIGFWDGRNRPGLDVSTGLYMVKITWQGTSIIQTLAVVR